jgi:hypothetical protein
MNFPGINPHSDLSFFTDDERHIINCFAARDWYVTRTLKISIAASSYKVILIKPLDLPKKAFNLNREVVVALSPYETFEPRSIDAIDYLDVQELRLEEICSIIISKDIDVESKLGNILKSNEEARVIIPFSYAEMLSNQSDPEYLISKIRKNFYGRDLFGIQDALKKDLYFFGRRDLIYTLLNRHLNGENSGVFGLRKTGKTSILYSIERALDRKKSISIFVDCQTLHLKSWQNALFSIIQELQVKAGVKKADLKMFSNDLVDDFIADHFFNDLKTVYRKNDKKSILLIFDEIENITFDTSISDNWKGGSDFIKFWQVIRSSHQKLRANNVFTYLITGTNPRCIEKSTINKADNPIFSQFSPIYIPAFDVVQTKEMIDKLGGYMGLMFDDAVSNKLVADFGGHPLLIRQMCSFIHKKVDLEKHNRPFKVNGTYYSIKKQEFLLDEKEGFNNYMRMVLEVLENWYEDEFQMLTWLSLGDYETFKDLANEVPEYVTHLLQYGLVEKAVGDYSFKVEALQNYVSSRNKYKVLNPSEHDKRMEVLKRVDKSESQLRTIVRQQLKVAFGEESAKKKVLSEIYKPSDIAQYLPERYSDLFSSSKHDIYLKTIFELMRKNWENCFRNIFDVDVEEFIAKFTILTKRRNDAAHGNLIQDSDFQSFRGVMEWLEGKIDDFRGTVETRSS